MQLTSLRDNQCKVLQLFRVFNLVTIPLAAFWSELSLQCANESLSAAVALGTSDPRRRRRKKAAHR